MSNRELFEQIVADKALPIQHAPLFDRAPARSARAASADRIEGMLLGLAIGDALGNTSESMSAGTRRKRFGEIRDYLFNRHAGAAVGLPSDDTQLAFWTIERMLDDGGLDPAHVAEAFTRDRIFGIGSTVRDFLRRAESGVGTWREWGQPSAGNGALMRIAPALLPHLGRPSPDVWVDAVLLAAITHRDALSISSCVAFVGMLWDLLHMDAPPPRRWWVERFAELAREVEGETCYTVRFGRDAGRTVRPSEYVAEVVTDADEQDLEVAEACERWGSGAYLLETLPSVLYVLTRHGDDPEEAIVRAVNDTWDNDTAGAIVGAAVGAVHGRAALPERWVRGLLGRTREQDDGAVFALSRRAGEAFGASW